MVKIIKPLKTGGGGNSHLLDDIEKILELDLTKQDNKNNLEHKNNLELFEKNLSKLQEKIFPLKADELQEPQEQTLWKIKEDDKQDNAGDFRSKDCIELLKIADIVVTNPPFSLFREYVAQLVEYEKKFLIVAHQNCITYKEIFSLIKDKKLWLGYGFKGGAGHFINYHYEDYATASDHKEGMIRVSGVTWVTNLTHKKRNEILETIASYTKTPEKYPKYDNYDAIEVSKVIEIPLDYNGVMGVPVTFMDKFNPKQFEILGITDRQGSSGLRTKKYTKEDTPKYNDLNARSVLVINGEYKQQFPRILIRKIAEVEDLRKEEQERM